MASVLLVEDDPLLAQAMRQSIELAGYDVIAIADSYESAVRALHDHKPEFALLDISLAGERDGIDVANAIQAQHPCKVIFTSAMSDGETLERASRLAPYGYLLKPVTSSQLQVAFFLAEQRAKLEVERDQLKRKLDNIRVILPLCSHCRSAVRTDDGSWQPLEKFLEERTGGRISHGVCPDCVALQNR